jgi:hypothetical protein
MPIATAGSSILLAPGHYCGTGLNSMCVGYDGRRNGARRPSYRQTDLRFSYRLRLLKTKTIDANFDLFNIFNTANFSNPGQVAFGSDQRLSDFLVLTALRGGNGQRRVRISAQSSADTDGRLSDVAWPRHRPAANPISADSERETRRLTADRNMLG